MSRPPFPVRKVFGAPALAAVVSLIGLIAALVSDGVGDVVAWIGLGLPLAMVAWAMARRRR